MLENPYGNWTFVGVLIIFSAFFITRYLPMRTVFQKRSGGALIAFFAALFTEMYGFPLTIYFLTSYFGIDIPLTHKSSHLLGNLISYFGFGNGWLIVMIISTILLFIGMGFIMDGWKLVYHSKGKLVTTGIYKRIRHPQYTGIFIIMIAFLIQWPTLITLIMFPFLIISYSNLAKREERDVLKEFPHEYKAYMEKTPMFIPRINGVLR